MKTFQGWLIPVCLLLVFTACQWPRGQAEAELSEVAEELNKKCPAMLDSDTRIDAIYLSGENTLRYNYTLVNLQVENVDTQAFRRALWPGILGMIRVSREMKKLRDAGTVIEYYYADKNNKAIYTFTVRPEDYHVE